MGSRGFREIGDEGTRRKLAPGRFALQPKFLKLGERFDQYRDVAGLIGQRLKQFLALNAAFWSAICIVISGTLYAGSWVEFWEFWRKIPIWAGGPI